MASLHRRSTSALTSSADGRRDRARRDFFTSARSRFGNPRLNGANDSLGAGGKGGPARTQAIDRNSCLHFIRAAGRTPSITKFLVVSYLGSRHNKAPWWSDEEWAATQDVNRGALKYYYPAKLDADTAMAAAATRHPHLQPIVLRPGALTDGEAVGKVSLGKTKARGSIRRGDVAAVAAELLDSEAKGWLDLLEGDEPIADAVQRVVRDKVDCLEGENCYDMGRDLLES